MIALPGPMARYAFDARDWQITVLGLLLGLGAFRLGFDLLPLTVGVILTTVLLTQWACTRLWRVPRFDPKSALISGFSLCLLLRTNSPLLAIAAAVIAVASKFALRLRGKHVFNPTNFGLVAMIALTGKVWISPGQWGSAAFFAAALACLGGLVVRRASRSDVTYAFLAFYLAMQLGRALWLGDPLSIPLLRVRNGALLVFAFFMISDPKTTPDSRAGRILFALLVASGACFVQFHLYRPNGLLWSLACCCAAVPLIDLLLPGMRYEWRPAARTKDPHLEEMKGASHETPAACRLQPSRPCSDDEPRPAVLRLLRGKGGRQALQPSLPGGDRAA